MTIGLRHSPIFIAKVGGLELTNAESPYQMSFSFREIDRGAKKLTLKIANANLELIDRPALVRGAEAEFRFGYPDWLSTKFKGTVKEVNPNFDPRDISLTLGIFDAVADTMSSEIRRVWTKEYDDTTRITESDVVEMLAGELGFEAEVVKTKNYYSEIVQAEEDFAFLKVLARRAKPEDASQDVGSYRVSFDYTNSKLIFKPVNLNTPVRRVFYYMSETDHPSLISFNVNATTYNPDTNGGVSTSVASVKPDKSDVNVTADNETESQRVSQGDDSVVDLRYGSVQFPDQGDSER